jgi:hypothetical protein
MQSSCRIFLLLFIALSTVLVTPCDLSLAQEGDEKSKLVQEIVVLLKEERYLERVFESATRTAAVENKEALNDIYSRLDQDEIYRFWAGSINQLYTTEELKAYLEFSSTDVGRSILRKETEIFEKLTEAVALDLLRLTIGK